MNRTKRAFTLIELLVVIAIIAILAAILFPVFAQAKAAAKKTAIIAQYKQVATGTHLYLGDSDDVIFRHDNQFTGQTIDGRKNPEIHWLYVCQPYIKNWDIVNDATIQDPLGVWSSTPQLYKWWANQQRWPTLGFNVNYMNNPGGDCGMWAKPYGSSPADFVSFGPPISYTSIQSPSATVLFVSTKRVGSAAGAYVSDVAESPASYNANDTCSWSNGGWGIGSYGDTAKLYPNNPTSTGDFAAAYTGQGMVIMSDTSAKSFQPGKVAAGTNWAVGIKNTAITITDRASYIWDTQQ